MHSLASAIKLPKTLLQWLEAIDIARATAAMPFRFPVQSVNQSNLDFRGYEGTVVSGHINAGDPIVVATTGRSSHVKEIIAHGSEIATASASNAVTLTLEDNFDIACGDLVSPSARPEVSDQFAAHIIWTSEDAMVPGRSYRLRIGTRTVSASITTLKHRDRCEQRRTLGRAYA